MIKYSLLCKDCNLTFESWFPSSKEYEKLKRKNFLNCQSCNSINIDPHIGTYCTENYLYFNISIAL